MNDLLAVLERQGMKGYDISDDELAKSHSRYMIGGAQRVENERLFRFGMLSFSFSAIEGPNHLTRVQNFLNGLERSGSSCWVCKQNGIFHCSIIATTAPVRKISASCAGLPLFH